MKKYLFMILLSCLIVNDVSFAIEISDTLKAKVGKQPIAIIPSRHHNYFDQNPDTLNIICLGFDANYNGVLNIEEGDELPSWWKIEGVINANPNFANSKPFNVRKVRDLDMNYMGLFPYRFRISEEIDKLPVLHSNLLPIASSDKVVFYDMSTEEQQDHAIVDSFIKSTCFYENFAFSTIRKNVSVLTMYKSHDFTPVLKYESEIKNIQRVITYTNPNSELPTIAVLYEQNYGETGLLEFHTAKMPLEEMTSDMEWENCFDIKSIEVGTSVNDMNLLNREGIPFLFVVSNGDNRVYAVDCSLQEVNGTAVGIDDNYVQMPANSGGIREISFFVGKYNIVSAAITTYDRYTFYISNFLADQHPIDSILLEGECMGDASVLFNDEIGIKGHQVLFARTLTYSDFSFSAGDEVEIFYINSLSIKEVNNISNAYPNPTKNIINIELENISKINSVRLIDYEGKNIQEINKYSVTGNCININLPDLQTGNYFIELNMQHKIHTQKIIIE